MNREILKLAIPNIISNISVPLLSAIDLALMGHQGANTPLLIGAVAIGSGIFNMLYWGFAFLRMGTTGLVAQAFGADRQNEISKLLGQGGLVAILSAILLVSCQVPLGDLCFWIMGTMPDTLTYEYAKTYFFIRIWAAPAVLLLYALNGWFFGMQNARYPMWIVIAINIVNILLNIILVVYFDMKVAGVAYGTLVAQYFGLLVACLFLLKNYTQYVSKLPETLVLKFSEFKRFFTINRDIFIRTVCLVITYTYFTRVSTLAGDVLLSVNTILLQLHYITSYAIDGFGFAAESLVGKYVGAKNKVLLKKSVDLCVKWGMAFSALFALVYGIFGTHIVALFAQHTDVIESSQIYIFWLVLAVLAGGPAFIWDGIYIGATASVSMRNNMLFATFCCFFPAYFFFEQYYQNHALWLAMITYMLARSIGLWFMANKKIYNL